MTFSSENKICSWCFEEKNSDVISWCTCGEISYVCHDCLIKGKKELRNKNLAQKCSICKQKQLTNLPQNLVSSSPRINLSSILTTILRHERQVSTVETNIPESPEGPIINDDTLTTYDEICKKLYRSMIWLIVFLIISWIFAPFSYFVIFRMKKDYFKKFYITLSTGMIFGFPLTFILRNYIRRYCLSSQ